MMPIGPVEITKDNILDQILSCAKMLDEASGYSPSERMVWVPARRVMYFVHSNGKLNKKRMRYHNRKVNRFIRRANV